jgi:hypothetical protein
MKSIINKMVLSMIVLFIILSCNDDENNFLSPDDKIAVEGMQTSYVNAVDQNSAFKISVENIDSIAMHMHDSLFHHYVDEYFEHHNNYSHESYHDDHHHDNHGMHMSNMDFADHHDWMDGHHQKDHVQIEDLLGDHDDQDHETNDHHEDNDHMGNH